MKIILFLALCLNCNAMDWWALHQVEGAPRPDQIGVTGDLGAFQISAPVWRQFAKSGEKWFIEADNRAVAERVMAYRQNHYKAVPAPLGWRQNDFRDALLWKCPGRLKSPSKTDLDFARRYANLCERKLKETSQ